MKPSRRSSVFCSVLLTFLLASLLTSFPRRVNAWGPSGHRIVALVAMKHLTREARTQIETLLGNQTLADVANWADDVRESRPNTAKWHFVNLPRNANSFSRSRDCSAASADDPGCAVTAIEMFRDILSGARPGDKVEALKFIVHFVGDIHQPLHVSFADDRGGNNIRVRFFSKSSNLHKVWDSGIINRANLSEAEFAAELEATLRDQSGDEEFAMTDSPTQQKITQIQSGTIDSWVNESFALAKSNAYDKVPRNGTASLGTAYYQGMFRGSKGPNWKVVDDQLTKGGLRLAKILNDALR
jgi:hypothetical protein